MSTFSGDFSSILWVQVWKAMQRKESQKGSLYDPSKMSAISEDLVAYFVGQVCERQYREKRKVRTDQQMILVRWVYIFFLET
jgi:hypothetical protein